MPAVLFNSSTNLLDIGRQAVQQQQQQIVWLSILNWIPRRVLKVDKKWWSSKLNRHNSRGDETRRDGKTTMKSHSPIRTGRRFPFFLFYLLLLTLLFFCLSRPSICRFVEEAQPEAICKSSNWFFSLLVQRLWCFCCGGDLSEEKSLLLRIIIRLNTFRLNLLFLWFDSNQLHCPIKVKRFLFGDK